MSLDTKDKKWIVSTLNTAINRSNKVLRKELREDTKRHLDLLAEKHHEEMELLRELTDVRPTRDEMRDMIREEIWPIGQETALFKEQMISFREEMSVFKSEMSVFKSEMSVFKSEMTALRKDYNDHVMACR